MGQLIRLFVVLLLLQLDSTLAFSDVDYFQYFIRKYGKNYEPNSSEYWRRFNIFRVKYMSLSSLIPHLMFFFLIPVITRENQATK